MRKFLRNAAVPAIACAMLAFALYHLLFAVERRPDLEPPSLPPVATSVAVLGAVGLVEPESENISIGSAQSGIVLDVYVSSEKAGTRVSKGDPLFRVDDRQLQAQLVINKANLSSAQAQLTRLINQPRKEDVEPLAAKVKVAEAVTKQWDDKVQRTLQLHSNALAKEDVAQRKLSLEVANAELAQAKEELNRVKAGAWEQDLDVAKAAVTVAQANVDYIETEIERCLVRAPIDGHVLQVNVRPGEYVNGSMGKTLVVLGKLDRLHVRVDIDEQEIPRFHAGAKGKGSTRGNARVAFPLEFVRVEPYVVPKKMLSGAAAERVDTRVLQVIYAVRNDPSDKDPLYVGQQLDVYLELQAGAKD